MTHLHRPTHPHQPSEIPVKSLFTPFRVRRAARQPGQADTLHALEWLGGEALVAPLPLPIGTEVSRPPVPHRSERGDADWRAI